MNTPLARTMILLAAVAASSALVGCIGDRPANPAATQPVTAIDAQTAEVSYWLAQPATASVAHPDFDHLWDLSERVAHEFLFSIDRRDQRSGLLVTQPLLSKQWFEPWRKDAATVADVAEASLGTIRRTIYFQFTRTDAGYVVSPKVVVERQSTVEPKYRTADLDVPTTYWYALRRDGALEEQLASAIRRHLERDR